MRRRDTSTPSSVRVLVAPHHGEIGGSQINALELAAEVAAMDGFEVEIYQPRGDLAPVAERLGLPVHWTVVRESAPSLPRIVQVWRLARRRDIDVVHTYEWVPTVDAAFAACALRAVPVVGTIMSMSYPHFVPEGVPFTLGTAEMVDAARARGQDARLLEPPVDTREFDRRVVDPDAVVGARSECGASDDEVLVVVVGRLAQLLKLEGILTLTKAVGRLAEHQPVRLAIVGDGPARDDVRAVVDEVNASAGDRVALMLGQRADPRPYYLAADVVVAMGSSALRAMALERPVVVQGEQGYWRVADESSVSDFLWQGWFGVGGGGDPVADCVRELQRLVADPAERDRLSRWGRDLVVGRYGLEAVAGQLAALYREVASTSWSRRQRLHLAARLAVDLAKYRFAMFRHRVISSVRGRG